jgi:hypothetical protein
MLEIQTILSSRHYYKISLKTSGNDRQDSHEMIE